MWDELILKELWEELIQNKTLWEELKRGRRGTGSILKDLFYYLCLHSSKYWIQIFFYIFVESGLKNGSDYGWVRLTV